jgi:hypothetical protein
MKLGDGELDTWNRKAMLFVCLAFLVIVLAVGWRLRVNQLRHMPKTQFPVGQLLYGPGI